MPLKNQGVFQVHKIHKKNEKRLHSIDKNRRVTSNLMKQSDIYILSVPYEETTSIYGTYKVNRTPKLKSEVFKKEALILLILFLITLFLICTTFNRIHLSIAVEKIKAEGLNYDYFRELRIPMEYTSLELKDKRKMNSEYDLYDYITLNTLMVQNDYSDVSKISRGNGITLLRNLSENNSFQELKGYYKAILEDIKVFPVNQSLLEKKEVSYIDSWNYLRSYGGKRKHEGTDIMSSENVPGVIKVLSMTDGIVEKMGWLEQGGNRVGIRGTNGAYFYYAHLDSYAPIQIGDEIKAGEYLGYMGDSGYGAEGTKGKFPVHLHVGIYVETAFGELSVNPYLVLKLLESK